MMMQPSNCNARETANVIRRSSFFACLLLSISIATTAQSREENWTKCGASDPDTSIAGCTALIQAGQESTTSSAMAYYDRGNAWGDKKEWDKAIADYDQCLKIAPDNAKGLINRGHAYMMKGEYDRAIEDYQAALRINPNDWLAIFSTGVAEEDKNNYVQAVTDFTRYIALKPDDPDGYESRGNDYRQQGQYDNAIADYNHALQVKADYSLAYWSLGVTHDYQGLYKTALTDGTKYIKLKPKDPAGFSIRGLAYYQMGQYARAIEDFDKAKELGPNQAYPFFDLGCAHLLAGQNAEAVADFERTIGVDSASPMAVSAALWLRLAKARLHQDATEELKNVAQKADLTKWPGAVLKFYLGQTTSNEAMVAAADPDPQTQLDQICEENFYAGEDALLRQQRATALARLKAARDGCPKSSFEYAATLVELKQMAAAPLAPAKMPAGSQK
jgi:lipoprotein NlpI